MRFPSAERVLYRRTSLVEVIGQVKFTPVLKIDTEVPADVQDALRGELPVYERQEVGLVPALGFPVQLPAELVERRVEHAFISEDGQARVTLARDFVALTVREYRRWESFEQVFARARAAVHAAYAPHGITRVGLRYQNVIRRESLGLGETPWDQLLRPSLLGMLAEEVAWRPDAVSRQEVYRLDLAGELVGTARVVHGTVVSGEDTTAAYLIDSDFFVEGAVVPDSLDALLDDLHAQSRSFFRHSVLEPLHEAMEPEDT